MSIGPIPIFPPRKLISRRAGLRINESGSITNIQSISSSPFTQVLNPLGMGLNKYINDYINYILPFKNNANGRSMNYSFLSSCRCALFSMSCYFIVYEDGSHFYTRAEDGYRRLSMRSGDLCHIGMRS